MPIIRSRLFKETSLLTAKKMRINKRGITMRRTEQADRKIHAGRLTIIITTRRTIINVSMSKILSTNIVAKRRSHFYGALPGYEDTVEQIPPSAQEEW